VTSRVSAWWFEKLQRGDLFRSSAVASLPETSLETAPSNVWWPGQSGLSSRARRCPAQTRTDIRMLRKSQPEKKLRVNVRDAFSVGLAHRDMV
jgi:hypothetical protein